MTCVVCGRVERSDPARQTDWRYLEVDEKGFYVCPCEFPPDGAGAEAFKVDYQVAIACCVNEITKAAGGPATPEIEKYRQVRRKAREQAEVKSKFKGFG